MFIKRQLQMQIPSHKIIEDLKQKKGFIPFASPSKYDLTLFMTLFKS